MKAFRVIELVLLGFLMLLAPVARAQNVDATMVTSLVATQGETLTYTVVISNRTANAITDLHFSDTLDPNTTLIGGSLNTSPLAFPDTYDALGNVQITVPAPGVLINDVDIDGTGPALVVAAATVTSANGGNVNLLANGGFTYNPPPGFEGVDTFTYTINDGEGFTDSGMVRMNVSGMIWFVNGAAPAGGDGRLTTPFNTLAAFAAINNGAGNNPAAGDSIFLYSGAYAGPLTLLNSQKLIGQGASASLASITGLTPPAGSLALPATGAARPAIGGGNGLTLAGNNVVRGLNFNNSGGTSMAGGSVGSLTVNEVIVTNTAGVGVNLAGGSLAVTLDRVVASGGAHGIRLVNCTGAFVVTGDAALTQNGSGGTIQNTTANGVHLDNVANISLSRMNINNSAANGVYGQQVNGLVLNWCSLNNNGDAVNECGIRLGDPVGANGLAGSSPGGANPTRIANTLIRASGEMNVAIFNSSGTLTQLDMTNVVSRDTRLRPLGADGFYFETRGSAVATVNFASCSFSNNFTQGLQALALGQSVLNVNVTACGFTNNNEGVVLGNGSDADIVFDINGNTFFNNLATGASGAAITAVNATTVTASALYSGKIRANTVIGGGIDNHGIAVLLAGTGNNTLQVANNNINAANAQFSGIFIQAGETGSGSLSANVTVTANTINLGALGSHGILVQSRIVSTLCAEIANNVSATGGVGLFGINVRQRDTSTFRLPGFAGPFNSTAAVIAFLQGKNPGTTIGSTVATAYSGGAACTLPSFAMPSDSPAPALAPTLAPEDPDTTDSTSTSTTANMGASPGGVVVNIGTLPPNKSITITFRAIVANPMPLGTCIISNQATVTATGGVSILTDDPRTPAPLDATLTAALVPPLAITQPATHVSGGSATLHGSVNPCGSIARYYFQYGPTTAYGSNTAVNTLPAGLAAVPVNATITGLDAGVTYHFRLVATNDFGTNTGADLTFTTPLTIVQQPASAVVCVGGAATFTVAASSPSVTYQWQRRDPGAGSFADIPGATAASYTTPPATLADDGAAFRAIISTPGASLVSAEAFLSVISVAAPAAIYDFNTGLPPNTAVYGNAFVDGGAGVLELNANAPSQAGAFLTTDLAPGRIVRGFAATFKARVQPGSSPPADGFSFNWAADLPNGVYAFGEEGDGSGLRVCFDTWDNGFAEAPAIDVWWGSNLVARKSVSIPFLVRGPGFFDVQIRLGPDGLLDVIYACEPVFARLPVTGYTPQMGARFGLGSRTGAAWETHSIDDLALELFLDLEGRPRISSIEFQPPSGILITGTGTPTHNYSVEVSTDLVVWSWRANVTADPMGFWQLFEPDIVDPPARFYRLRGAPQFPSGLVAWYRADGDYLDSFGPNHGTPEGGMAFNAGQRGQAFSFDGVAQSMVTAGATIPVPWTAAFWVNRQDTPDASAALLSDDISALKLEQWPSTRQVGFTQFGVADYYFTYIAPANTWIHLTFVGTFTGTVLYVNGTAIETHPNVINLPLRFMGRRDIGVDHLKGLLDEITIFNRALTPAEVQQVRDATRGP